MLGHGGLGQPNLGAVPGGSSPPQNPPFVGTSVPVAVQVGWLARTSPLPIVGADFAPTLPVAAQNPLLGSAVPLAVRIAWSLSPPSFIVARNLKQPISGPDNPPFRGALVPIQVQLGWLARYPAPPTPFLPRKILPTSGPTPTMPPLIGMRVPVAVEAAWLPPPAFPLPKARLSFSGPAPVPPTPLDNPEDFVLYTAEIELWFLTDRET